MKYILSLDPSKNSTGLVLLSLEPFKVLEAGVLVLPRVEHHTKNYAYVLSNILETVNSIIKKYSLSGSDTIILMENLCLGRNTSSLLWHIFHSLISLFTKNPFNVYTFLPITIKGFCKSLLPSCPFTGILMKEHILSIYRTLESKIDFNPFPSESFNDDVLDAYFLSLIGLFIEGGLWKKPNLSPNPYHPLREGYNLDSCYKYVSKKMAKTYTLKPESKFVFPQWDCNLLRERYLSGEDISSLLNTKKTYLKEVLESFAPERIAISCNSKGYFLSPLYHPIS